MNNDSSKDKKPFTIRSMASQYHDSQGASSEPKDNTAPHPAGSLNPGRNTPSPSAERRAVPEAEATQFKSPKRWPFFAIVVGVLVLGVAFGLVVRRGHTKAEPEVRVAPAAAPDTHRQKESVNQQVPDLRVPHNRVVKPIEQSKKPPQPQAGSAMADGVPNGTGFSGVWTNRHGNGSVRTAIEYQNGLRHGTYREWSATGTLIEESGYAEGLLSGKYTRFWGYTGKPQREVKYVKGLREGTEFQYGSEGGVMWRKEYRGDRLASPPVCFDEGGKPFTGDYRTFYTDEYDKARTNRCAIVEAVNGIPQGNERLYYFSGRLLYEVTNVGGYWDGVYRLYTEGGVMIKAVPYRHGLIHGEVLEYALDGTTVVARATFVDGEKQP